VDFTGDLFKHSFKFTIIVDALTKEANITWPLKDRFGHISK